MDGKTEDKDKHVEEFKVWAAWELGIEDGWEVNMSNIDVKMMLKGWLAARGF